MMKVLAGGSIPRVGFGTFRKLPMIPYLTIAPSTLATVASLFYALVYMEYNWFVHFFMSTSDLYLWKTSGKQLNVQY